MANLVTQSEVHVNTLIADISFPLQTATVRLAAGQGVLLAGSILGKNSAGEAVLVGGTTSVEPEFILTDDIDTEAAINAVVYASGAFIRSALIVASGTIDDYESDLKKNGLYLKAAQ